MRYLTVIFLAFTAAGSALASTNVLFSDDPQTAFSVGPFPSNVSTTPDSSQLTGLRISLPSTQDTCMAAALGRPGSNSVCGSNAALNQLDGFSVNPRVMVCFSGPVNYDTLKSGISIQPISGGGAIPVNELEWDANSNCVFAKPDSVLQQQSTYLLVVRSAVHDASGPAQADPGFEACLQGGAGYCASLASAAKKAAIQNDATVVGASLFTTLSATPWLEQVRKSVDALPLVTNLPAGFPNSFQLKSVRSINWMPAQSGLGAQPVPISSLAGVDSVAFGFFLSPNYIATSGAYIGTIPQTPTALAPAAPNTLAPVSYHLFLPPANKGHKIPVVIYGHGLGDSQFGAPTYIASKLAQNGFATLAMEEVGHGYGQASYVNVTDTSGHTFYEWTPGRGVLLNGSTIGATDGCIAPGAVAVRDCARQTTVDLFTLVAMIRSTNGLGYNLDPSRIYYVGQSFGSTVGTLFQATEPAVKAAVLNVGGGTSAEVARLAITGEPLDAMYITTVAPALTADSGCITPLPTESNPQPVPGNPLLNCFNSNFSFRNQLTLPPAASPYSVPMQAAFEAADWLDMPGDPLAFGSHLQPSALLAGVPHKNTLFQFGYGDMEVPNPTETALVRTANGAGTATFLHFDQAVALDPNLLFFGQSVFGFPILPHRILSNPSLGLAGSSIPGYTSESSISYALQQQVIDFFASDGTKISDPNLYLTAPYTGVHLFDPLTKTQVPEALNYPAAP